MTAILWFVAFVNLVSSITVGASNTAMLPPRPDAKMSASRRPSKSRVFVVASAVLLLSQLLFGTSDHDTKAPFRTFTL